MVTARLQAEIASKKSLLCLGLDPEYHKLPPFLKSLDSPFSRFASLLLDTIGDLCVAIKPNLAFFEAEGANGIAQLETILKSKRQDHIWIADAKRADIGNSSRLYAEAFYDRWKFDAVTVAPYMGEDSVKPFLEVPDKLAFLLCLTSNSGSADFEEAQLRDGQPLFELVLKKALSWNQRNTLGLVVGATKPERFELIRRLAPEVPILVPGVGTQGGDASRVITLLYGKAAAPTLINIGRAVIYPEGEFFSETDYAHAVRQKAEAFVRDMRRTMAEISLN